MHNVEFILKNGTHKIPRKFDIQTDHLISARRPELMIANKKQRAGRNMVFAVSAEHREKPKEVISSRGMIYRERLVLHIFIQNQYPVLNGYIQKYTIQ